MPLLRLLDSRCRQVRFPSSTLGFIGLKLWQSDGAGSVSTLYLLGFSSISLVLLSFLLRTQVSLQFNSNALSVEGTLTTSLDRSPPTMSVLSSAVSQCARHSKRPGTPCLPVCRPLTRSCSPELQILCTTRRLLLSLLRTLLIANMVVERRWLDEDAGRGWTRMNVVEPTMTHRTLDEDEHT
jgi:hypothetical protein